MGSDVDGDANGLLSGANSGMIAGSGHSSTRGATAGGTGRHCHLTREAVEKVTRDANLAEGLKAAERELKDNSRASSAGEESEGRDSVHLGQQVEEVLVKRGVECSRRRSSPGNSSVGKEETSAKSNSGSSQANSQPPQAGLATATSSSGGTGSTSTQQALTDLLERLAFAQDARVKAEDDLSEIRKSMADAADEYGIQVADLQKKLKKALLKERERGKDNSVLLQKIAGLEAMGQAQAADMQQQLAAARHTNVELRNERDTEEDRLCGYEARTAERVELLKGELQEVKTAALRQKTQELAHQAASSEMLELRQQLAAERSRGKDLADQGDVLRRTEQDQRDAHAAEASRLKGMLDAANRELRILNEAAEDDAGAEDDRSDLALALDDGEAQRLRRPRFKQLEAALESHRESQREMSDELSELRLHMSGMELGHQAQIGDLQSLLDQANQRLLDGGFSGSPTAPAPALPRGAPQRRRSMSWSRRNALKKNELACIDEEEDDEVASNDGSLGASGNVSSGGDDGVGDLRDFEDAECIDHRTEDLARISLLETELAEAREENWKLKEDLAGSRAEWSSKYRRLTESLNVSQEGDALAKQELASLRHTIAGQTAQHTAQLDSLRQLLAVSESDVADKDELYRTLMEEMQRKEEKQQASHDEAKQELFRALEAKRIASNRLEDMKRELESTHKRYEVIIADLRAQLARGEQVGTERQQGELVDAGELQAVKEQLQGTTEDRNVLAHTLEWKEVQWKSKLEHLELENKQLVSDLKQQHSVEVDKLQRKLNEAKADFQQRLEKAEQMMKEAQSKAQAPAPPTAAGVAGGWLGLLRCPTRMPETSGRPVTMASSGAPEATFCREVCWQVLNSVPGTIALMCDSPSLKILQASEGAVAIWGSQRLNGSLVVSLLQAPASAAWLRRAILTHQALARIEGGPGDVPGFAVHALGRLEFQHGGHSSFESSVTVAHLPAEPRLNREVAVVVMIEPLVAARAPPRSSEVRSEVRGGYTQSVVSDDVQPSDSASNIATRYY